MLYVTVKQLHIKLAKQICYITYNKFVSKLSSMLIFAKGNGV